MIIYLNKSNEYRKKGALATQIEFYNKINIIQTSSFMCKINLNLSIYSISKHTVIAKCIIQFYLTIHQMMKSELIL